MKRARDLLRVACIAVLAGAVPAFAGAAEPVVVSQDLLKVPESGKVAAAVWTRRTDSYTLQLVIGPSNLGGIFFTGNTVANSRCPVPSTGTRILTTCDSPAIQVWLLRADGAQILPGWRGAPPAGARGCGAVCRSAVEILYRFPLDESAQAVAIAIQVDDRFYIEKLEPLDAGHPAR